MTTPPPPMPPPAVPGPPRMPPPPRTLHLGDLLVTFGALVVFAFSFAPFVQYGDAAREDLAGTDDLGISHRFNAWSLETFMVPLTTFVILAVLLAAAAVWVRFALRRDPSLVGFRLRQLEVGLTLFGFVVLLGMVVSEKAVVVGYRRFTDVDPQFWPAEQGRLDVAWGAVLLLIGAFVALVGAVLNHLGVRVGLTVGGGQMPPPPPPPPAGYAPWQGAPPQQQAPPQQPAPEGWQAPQQPPGAPPAPGEPTSPA